MSFKITAAALVILSLNSIACGTVNVPTAKQAAMLDTATTVVVLESRAGHEANPVGFVGATLAKVLILSNIDRFEPQTQEYIKRATATVWTAAAVNNLAVLACAPIAISLPLTLAAGYVVYTNTPTNSKNRLTQKLKQ
jgi:hypothetical protein